MADRPRKKGAAARKSAPASKAAKAAGSSRRLIVQFNLPADPNTEQTEAVRDLVKKFARAARVAGEMPGALKVDVQPEAEEEFRRAVQDLPDWDVSSEGTAAMPPPPVQEDLENDEEDR